MDPITNPYAPGAGYPPPELAGRDELREAIRIATHRVRAGRQAKSALMIGLRGVGKTVLLDRMRDDAEAGGLHTIRIEAPENRSLPSILAPQLRGALLRLSMMERSKDVAQRALSALAGFAKALKVKYADIEVGVDFAPVAGLADNGDLEHDLSALLEIAGQAAKEADTALIIFIDELQYVEEDQLASLITALHRCAQKQAPVMLVGAGLPQLPGLMGRAKSYAERLFDFPFVGPLDDAAARDAIEKPAEALDVLFEVAALDLIVKETEGYPYFLQEWGKHAWDAADNSPIDVGDVQKAAVTALAALDANFFVVRMNRMTPSEKRYLRAMAELGPGPHKSGAIAGELGRRVESLAPTRSSLIKKGMIWSPAHGDTAFTVPMFDRFMRRAMEG